MREIRIFNKCINSINPIVIGGTMGTDEHPTLCHDFSVWNNNVTFGSPVILCLSPSSLINDSI